MMHLYRGQCTVEVLLALHSCGIEVECIVLFCIYWRAIALHCNVLHCNGGAACCEVMQSNA